VVFLAQLMAGFSAADTPLNRDKLPFDHVKWNGMVDFKAMETAPAEGVAGSLCFFSWTLKGDDIAHGVFRGRDGLVKRAARYWVILSTGGGLVLSVL
jgi:hypothetical protein